MSNLLLLYIRSFKPGCIELGSISSTFTSSFCMRRSLKRKKFSQVVSLFLRFRDLCTKKAALQMLMKLIHGACGASNCHNFLIFIPIKPARVIAKYLYYKERVPWTKNIWKHGPVVLFFPYSKSNNRTPYAFGHSFFNFRTFLFPTFSFHPTRFLFNWL